MIFAGILLGIFNAVLGGDATFKQVFAIVAHSTLIGALQNAFSRPLDYVRETSRARRSLSVLLRFIEEKSFLGAPDGMLDLFQVLGRFFRRPSAWACSTSGARRRSPRPCSSFTS